MRYRGYVLVLLAISRRVAGSQHLETIVPKGVSDESEVITQCVEARISQRIEDRPVGSCVRIGHLRPERSAARAERPIRRFRGFAAETASGSGSREIGSLARRADCGGRRHVARRWRGAGGAERAADRGGWRR